MINLNYVPCQPGCYLFKDKAGIIIYVGKAANLKKRVVSYFSGEQSPKTKMLVRNIDHAEYIVVDNETEALLLENKLIKQHSPKYNISLKDAKTFAYILLTREKFPRITTTRKIGKKGRYFGPYVDGTVRQEVMRLAIQLFKLRVCKSLPKKACLNYHIGLCTAPCIFNVGEQEYATQVNKAMSFLEGKTKNVLEVLHSEMNLASKQLKFEIALQKKRQILAIEHLTERQKVDVQKQFDQDVLALIENPDYATVLLLSIQKGVLRSKKEFRFDAQEDVLCSFIKMYYSQNPIPKEIIVNQACWTNELELHSIKEYLVQLKGSPVDLTLPERGEKLALVHLAEKNAQLSSENVLLKELQEKLNLPELPTVIECFDISNLGSDYIVAAMTQWVNGNPNKRAYRKFKIRSVQGKNDDFASMREVVFRRYARLQKEIMQNKEKKQEQKQERKKEQNQDQNSESNQLPQLIIIDGGKGQLDAALSSLQRLGLQIPIVGLAKEREELYLPGEATPLQFNPTSQMMLLVRGIRDSVHNFVLSYNRKRREMRLRDEAKSSSTNQAKE